jgi:hypothetical protein
MGSPPEIPDLIWSLSDVGGAVHDVDMKQSSPIGHTSVLRIAGDDELCALTIAIEEARRLLDALRVASAGGLADRSRRGRLAGVPRL